MTLPRFTSGSVGRLEFSHLNQAFAAIDEREASLHPSSIATESASGTRLPLIVAKITGRSGENHSWVEVKREASNWSVLDGGRTSTLNADAYAFPAITTDGIPVPNDSIVMLIPKRSKTGSILYLALNPGAGTIQPVRIESFEVITNNKQWRYTAKAVTVTASGTPLIPTYAASGNPFVLFNTVEDIADTTTIYGVGSYKNANFTITRMPLRVGLIVNATKVSSSVWITSTPNGYKYECQ